MNTNPMQMVQGMMAQNPGMQQAMNMVQTIKNAGNPMGIIQNIGSQNPMMQQAINMVQNNGPMNIEQTARNICQQKGIDFNQFVGMMKQMGLPVPTTNG